MNCAVDLYGLSDLSQVGMDYSPEVQQLHKSAGATEALWVNGSPVFGGKDGASWLTQSYGSGQPHRLYREKQRPHAADARNGGQSGVSGADGPVVPALKAKGVPAERYEIPGAAHGGVYWVQDKVLQVIGDFFDRYLK